MNSENNIYLDFLQQNLFKVNGNVWEVILPTVENKEGEGDYTIIVHLPPILVNKSQLPNRSLTT